MKCYAGIIKDEIIKDNFKSGKLLEELGKIFTYVSDKSYKCQRSIPMSFFEEQKGKVVYNL